MTATFRTKIRRVRFKSGGEIYVLPKPSENDRAACERVIGRCLDNSSDVCGMAIVVWSPDCSSTAGMVVSARSVMPSATIPDFVRNRLLAEKIEQWTIETIQGK